MNLLQGRAVILFFSKGGGLFAVSPGTVEWEVEEVSQGDARRGRGLDSVSPGYGGGMVELDAVSPGNERGWMNFLHGTEGSS